MKKLSIWKGIQTTWNLDQRINLRMLQIMKSNTYYLTFSALSPAYFNMKVIKAVGMIKVINFFFFWKILLQMSDTY